MSEEKALTVDTGTGMPALTIQQAAARYEQMVAFVRSILREGIDYGVIPGTTQPTLLKPGAEKLCTFFGLSVEKPELVGCVEDWDKGFFYYRYRITLTRDGKIIASAEGSVNSKEKKYRLRYIPTWQATEEEKARALGTEERTAKNGRKYTVFVLENDDLYSLVNTLQKMAQKRALIAATLIAVNASDYFTQDLEDLDYSLEVVEGECKEIPKEKPPTQPSDVEVLYGPQESRELLPVQPTAHGNWWRALIQAAREYGYTSHHHVINALKKIDWDPAAMDYEHRDEILAALKARKEQG